MSFTWRSKTIFYLAAWCLISGAPSIAFAEPKSDSHPKPLTYSNPILTDNGADPDVILVNGTYYLYPTTHGRGYDAWTSTDLVNWKFRGPVFTAPYGGAWAPDVFHNKRGNRRFYLYYTVSGPDSPPHGPFGKRIGVAVSDSPLGPFEDKKVLATGAIDAHMFQDDDGRYYLYYAQIEGGFKILVQRMADPLTKMSGRDGEPIELLHPTGGWETASGEVTEGPFMLKHNGTYYLMYSGSGADTPNYAVGYATSKSPTGPFNRFAGNPIAHRGKSPGAGGAEIFGPGHHCVVTGPDGKLWMIYHQKYEERRSYDRFIALDPIWFDDKGQLHARLTRGTDEPEPVK